MKILVLSDSHGVMGQMQWAVMTQTPDMVIHLGDHFLDAEQLSEEFPTLPVLRVPGNCDRMYDAPEKIVRDLGGVRIFFTHGHRYHVKLSYLNLKYAAREAGAQVALFGHTHVPFCQRQEDGLWLMNPGACGAGRPSCGILTIENGTAQCRLLPLSEEERP